MKLVKKPVRDDARLATARRRAEAINHELALKKELKWLENVDVRD